MSSILRHTAEVLGLKTNEEFEELYDKTAWYYDEKYKRPGAAYDIFARAVRYDRVLKTNSSQLNYFLVMKMSLLIVKLMMKQEKFYSIIFVVV